MAKDVIDLDEQRFNKDPVKQLDVLHKRFEIKYKALQQLIDGFKSETVKEGLKNERRFV